MNRWTGVLAGAIVLLGAFGIWLGFDRTNDRLDEAVRAANEARAMAAEAREDAQRIEELAAQIRDASAAAADAKRSATEAKVMARDIYTDVRGGVQK